MAWSNPQVASRTRMKMERCARLEMAGFSDDQIAMTVGITKVYVSMLRRTPAYQALLVSVASGIIPEMDRLLIEDQEAIREELKQMVPMAMLTIRNAMLRTDNSVAGQKLKLEASKEILDREGTFAKVSKSEIKKTETFKFDENTLIANDLLAALRTVADNSSTEDPTAEGFSQSADLTKDQQKVIQGGMDLIDQTPGSKMVQ